MNSRSIFLACLLFAGPAPAADLAFGVRRSGCEGHHPRTELELKTVGSRWLSPSKLEMTVWDVETGESRILDGSGKVDKSVPGVLALSYKDAPITGTKSVTSYCSDFVKVRFVVTGLKRGEYSVTINGSAPTAVKP